MIIDYDGHFSSRINICRGAPQGSVFRPMAYIIAHCDLPQIFERSEKIHLYVDDLAIAHSPSIHLNHRKQIGDIERVMNDDIKKLYTYTTNWYQPVNVSKTEYVIYHRAVQSPNIDIIYNGTAIGKKTSYKYLGFGIDAQLSFRYLLDDQIVKLRRAYTILEHIHHQFPSFFTLKKRFFNTYAWPHLYTISTIYCLLSTTAKERINGFHRRCLRMIYCLYQCSTTDLHDTFGLPTLETEYKKCLMNRIKNIQLHELEFISCYLLRKYIVNIVKSHYKEKACIPWLQKGRPNKRIVAMYNDQNNYKTFF